MECRQVITNYHRLPLALLYGVASNSRVLPGLTVDVLATALGHGVADPPTGDDEEPEHGEAITRNWPSAAIS